MFLWSTEKKSKKKGRSERESEESEFGIKLDKGPDDKQLEAELKRLAGVDNLPEDNVNLNEGEEDVESELLRLIGGGKEKKPSRRPVGSEEPVKDISELTADIDFGDEDIEVDENDPELLGELLELTNPDDAETEELEEEEGEGAAELDIKNKSSGEEFEIITALKERLNMYRTAEANAKKNNESSRARRFARGIKTLEDLLKKAKIGQVISPNDIPPVIALNLKPALPQPEVPEVVNETSEESEDLSNQCNSTVNPQDSSSPSETGDVMGILTERLEMYQTAETKAKENGDLSRARRFSRGIKTLKSLIKEAQAGNEIALENIPPVVALNLKPAPVIPVKPPDNDSPSDNYEEIVNDEAESTNVINSFDDVESEQKQERNQVREKNIQEVLLERLQMYKTAEAKAKEDGETLRARRFTRGVKTLQDLIKQASAGKLIASEDIPPAVALNLKPAFPPIVINEEEKSRDVSVERENLVRSWDAPEKFLSFTAVDDVDIDELVEETPRTVLEGLEQRAKLYRKCQEKAMNEGNSALADQNEKIVKIYLNAIRVFKKGEYVDVERLPNPKGYPPIPIPFFVP